MGRHVAAIAAFALMSIPAGTALAQSAATCAFDAGTLTVTLDGTPATLSVSGAGTIDLDGAPCAGATTTTTDLVQVNGGGLADRLTLSGSFAPGATAEPSGTSEIEIGLALGGGSDTLAVKYGNTPDVVTFTAGGIDVGSDGDEDLTTGGVETINLMSKGGDDTMDARAYLGGGLLVLDGGDGADVVYGSAVRDRLLGSGGNDTLYGGGGNDTLIGGDGDDVLRGGPGDDRMIAGAVVDGADRFFGGAGHDTVDYSARTSPVSVTPSSSGADDGEPGVEFDRVDLDVEEIAGGAGADILTCDDATGPVVLRGNAGNDQIRGGPYGDDLFGGSGDDDLFGGLGDDRIYGQGGRDRLNERFAYSAAFDGNDLLYGGTGSDWVYYNYRFTGVTLTLGNDLADDGTPGVEFDYIASDVENAVGSGIDDVLVGSEGPNELRGSGEIYGGGGDDKLVGSGYDDILVGDAGDDSLYGGDGSDTLDGGDGDDLLNGGNRADTLDGGAGVDQYIGFTGDDTFYNGDGVAETVDCGGGTDDAEPDPLDTFIGCENI